MMLELTEFLIRGALLGSIYGLLAYPISLLFVTTDSVDLAVGAYAVLAASIAFAIGGPAGILMAMVCSVTVSYVVGVLSMTISRGARQDTLVAVLATFGLATFLDSFVLTIFGKDPMVRQPFDSFWDLNGIRVSPQAGINLSIAVILLVALYVGLYRTSIGRDMRACAANKLAAELAGIPVKRISLLTYMAGGLLASIAGILILYTTGTNYSAGLGLTIWGFGAATLFGMHKPLRGFVGGIAIGVVQAFSIGYLPGAWATVAPLGFIIIALATGRVNVAQVAGGRA